MPLHATKTRSVPTVLIAVLLTLAGCSTKAAGFSSATIGRWPSDAFNAVSWPWIMSAPGCSLPTRMRPGRDTAASTCS